MNNTDIKKKIAYDLTLEYIRENNILMVNPSKIEETTLKVKEFYDYFHSTLEKIDATNF